MPETLEERHQRLADALRNGVDRLGTDDRLALATLFVYEARKGAFSLGGREGTPATIAFAAHVAKEFGTGSGVTLVFDYQWRLLGTARLLASKLHPIEALILYATWAEHWLNGLLLCRTQFLGGTPKKSDHLVRSANFGKKLGAIWEQLELPTLAAKRKDQLSALTKARNRVVHYRWEGLPPSLMVGENDPIARSLDGVEGLLRYLWVWTLDEFDGDHIAVADKLFGTNLRAHFLSFFENASGD